jgi:glycerol-3-phosphate acyltransferase PlsY
MADVGSPDALGLAVLALFEGLVPRHTSTVNLLSGPLVLSGYLVGSVPFGYLLSRHRLRRQLRSPHPPARGTVGAPALDQPGTILAGALTVAATLAITTLAWHLVKAAAPGGFSPIGTYANQAIAAWASVALWTGTGAVVGNIGSVWLRFRGGTGVVPAGALVFAYAPMVFAVTTVVFVVASAVWQDPRRALLLALPLAVVVEYLAWLADVQRAWGITSGPEVSLWITVLATTLVARNLRPAAPAGTADDGS